MCGQNFRVGQQQRAYALGVVLDDGLAEIVRQTAIAAGRAAETGHQTDAAQLQSAVRAHAQMTVTGAVERLLTVGRVALGQVAQTHALEHGVGEQCAAGGLKVVAFDPGLVYDLPEHAALGILKAIIASTASFSIAMMARYS